MGRGGGAKTCARTTTRELECGGEGGRWKGNAEGMSVALPCIGNIYLLVHYTGYRECEAKRAEDLGEQVGEGGGKGKRGV